MAIGSRVRGRFAWLFEHPSIWFGLFLLGVVAVAVAASQFASVGAWLQKWATSVSAVVSALFTVALVVLYKQQKDLKEAEYRPIVRFEGYRATPDGTVEILLSNVGDAPAVNLTMESEVEQITGGSLGVHVERGEERPIRELEEDENEWIRTRRNYLNPRERFRRFVGGFHVRIDQAVVRESGAVEEEPTRSDRVRSALPFVRPNLRRRTVFWLQRLLDDELVRVRSSLRWEDTLGHEYEMDVIDDVFPMSESFSVNRILVSGRSYDQYEAYDHSKESFFSDFNFGRASIASPETVSAFEREGSDETDAIEVEDPTPPKT